MVTEPERPPPPFGATVSTTGPLRFPLAPNVTIIQSLLAAAVQVQPDAVVTVRMGLLKPAGADIAVGETEYVQITGALGVTVMVTFTVCGEFDAFGEVIVTVPLYVPAAWPVGLTATVSAVGVPPMAAVVPVVGVTLSQVPPLGVVAA